MTTETRKRNRGATSPYLMRPRRSFEEAQAESAVRGKCAPEEVVSRDDRTNNRTFKERS